MNKYSKSGKAAIILILLFLWYSMIFSFSAQNGETSGSLSSSITLKTAQVFDKLTFGHRSEEKIAHLAENLEFPIRKAAHCTEYAVLGCLWFFFFRIIFGKTGGRKQRIWMLVCIGIVFLSAAGDEFHQTFIPGRSGNLGDVLLDTAGGFTGIFLSGFFTRRARGRNH